ncbi:acetylcholinesterase-like [Dermacentor andersoni]|uniref:acetylcholinesterase-like n=1 Tax=Dermacentor andersoni TaxID=34620 RepID=UPI002155EB1E|nr:acetylcholinesterase-like [Dermacentor andersoni]
MNSVACLLAYLATFCSLHEISSLNTPTVRTASGFVAGQRLHVEYGEVETFYGIPYATPPIGRLRFRKPLPVKPWNGVLNVTMKTMACWQTDFTPLRNVSLTYPVATEDCLHVNVWRPSHICDGEHCCSGKNLSVVVFIYGGAFQWGDAGLFIYDPANFVALSDVVYVTFNHRLGILGFYPASPDGRPGNIGFYDQLSALRWVKENIACFGGNPDDVTLIGHSAGAMSVGLHSTSAASRGLFKRAILQSGTPITLIIGVAFSGSLLFRDHAEKLGCYDSEVETRKTVPEILNCLRQLDAKTIYSAIGSKSIQSQLFVPDSGDEFLPANLLSEENWKKIHVDEMFIGTTSEEGALFIDIIRNAAPDLDSALTEDYRKGIAFALYLVFEIPMDRANLIAEHYFGGPEVQHDEENVIRTVGTLLADVLFNCPAHFFATTAAKEGVATYMYEFDHRPSYSLWPKHYGPTHVEELPFTFGVLPFFSDESRFTPPLTEETREFVKSVRFTPEEHLFMRQIVDVWSSFIKKGKIPLPASNETWPKYSGEHPELITMKPNSFKRRKLSEPCNLFKPFLVKE